VREGAHREALLLAQPEICQPDFKSVGYEHILRLDVPVEHAHCVAICRGEDDLERDNFYLHGGEVKLVDELAQVLRVEVEHQKHLGFHHQHFLEWHDVFVLQVFQECNLP